MKLQEHRFRAITTAREAGATWESIADGSALGVEGPQYVNAASAQGSYRQMLRKRGLRLAYTICPTCGRSLPSGFRASRR